MNMFEFQSHTQTHILLINETWDFTARQPSSPVTILQRCAA